MLREYQDQIKALRDQLAATQRGVMIQADGTVRVVFVVYFHFLCAVPTFVLKWCRLLELFIEVLRVIP